MVTSLYCHNYLISLIMLDCQRKRLMHTDVKRREIGEWSDHTPLQALVPPCTCLIAADGRLGNRERGAGEGRGEERPTTDWTARPAGCRHCKGGESPLN